MNKEIKEKWVAALRSGEYKQTDEFLKRPDCDTGDTFCCLGVLCDLHAKETGNKWNDQGDYFGRDSLLPSIVSDWAGLTKTDPDVKVDCNSNHHPDLLERSLSDLNDSGYDFFQIADLIEKQL